MAAEPDLRSAVEAAFGPGAFDLLEEDDALGEVGVGENETDGTADLGGELARQETDALFFETSGEWFAIPIRNVVEIQKLPGISWIPRAPGWLLGVISLRGNVLSAVDLHQLLSVSNDQAVGGGLMVVVRSLQDGMTTALVANKVSGIRRVVPGRHDTTAAEGASEHCFAIATIECEGRTATMLDVEQLLNSNVMRLFHSA